MSDLAIREYCFNLYDALFKENYDSLKITNTETKRTLAQKHAIGQASIRAMKVYPNVEPYEIWTSIYAAHVNKYTGLTDPAIIEKIIKADNSWKKSSGHAFEEMIKELGNIALKGSDIEFVLQKQLSRLLTSNEILNEVRDISWLKEQCKSNIFDLYLIKKEVNGYHVFGCVQSKTSIRDRVTRDREPSINAMKAYFISIAVVLNGSYLRMPKFTNMVNGDSKEYEINGWHNLYVLSNENIDNDRIKSIDINMEILAADVILGYESWLKRRQWLDHKWRPEDSVQK